MHPPVRGFHPGQTPHAAACRQSPDARSAPSVTGAAAGRVRLRPVQRRGQSHLATRERPTSRSSSRCAPHPPGTGWPACSLSAAASCARTTAGATNPTATRASTTASVPHQILRMQLPPYRSRRILEGFGAHRDDAVTVAPLNLPKAAVPCAHPRRTYARQTTRRVRNPSRSARLRCPPPAAQ